jgi:predicted RNA-binding Zn-ribbon protein involved in translation (DUF1610 family)
LFGSAVYLEQIPLILDGLDIQTSGYKYIKTLPSGKQYCSVSIHRTDFLNKGGYCVIAFKQNRLVSANRKGQASKNHVPCPNCGKLKSPKAKKCRECFRVDEDQINHLRSIAADGGIAKSRLRD